MSAIGSTVSIVVCANCKHQPHSKDTCLEVVQHPNAYGGMVKRLCACRNYVPILAPFALAQPKPKQAKLWVRVVCTVVYALGLLWMLLYALGVGR